MGERRAFLGLIASLVGSAWCALWIWGRSPYGRYLGHEQLGEIGAGSLLLPDNALPDRLDTDDGSHDVADDLAAARKSSAA